MYVNSIIDNAPTLCRRRKLKWGCSACMLFLPLLKICQFGRPWALLYKQHVCLLLFTMHDYAIRSYNTCIYQLWVWLLIFSIFLVLFMYFLWKFQKKNKKMKNECEYCWKYFTYENMIICSYSTHMCTFSTYKL